MRDEDYYMDENGNIDYEEMASDKADEEEARAERERDDSIVIPSEKTIDSATVLYRKTGDDENFTPKYGVTPILKYIKHLAFNKNANMEEFIVWCPFDGADSEYVIEIQKLDGVKVVRSHIDDGKDFFEYEPEEWDVIVSNPPFSRKRLYFERALSLGKPFALLMTNTAMNDTYPVWCWREAGEAFQMLRLNKRIHFRRQDGSVSFKTTFSCSYFCCNFLPVGFIQEPIDEVEYKKQKSDEKKRIENEKNKGYTRGK